MSHPAPPTSPVSRAELLGYFDALGITHHTMDHQPVFTVDEGENIKSGMPGAHTKNLFLKDKKGQLVLISALQSTKVNLKQIHHALGVGRLSFGKPDLLLDALGVTPGSVTAFAIINDPAHTVRFILDEALMDHEIVNFHPMRNDATTGISSKDLIRFVEVLGRTPEIRPLDI